MTKRQEGNIPFPRIYFLLVQKSRKRLTFAGFLSILKSGIDIRFNLFKLLASLAVSLKIMDKQGLPIYMAFKTDSVYRLF